MTGCCGIGRRQLPQLFDPLDSAVGSVVVFDLDVSVGIDRQRGGDVQGALSPAESIDHELGDAEGVIDGERLGILSPAGLLRIVREPWIPRASIDTRLSSSGG